MQILINMSSNETLYIRSIQEVNKGGFSFILYSGEKDHITYDGDSKYKQKCYNLARVILEEFK